MTQTDSGLVLSAVEKNASVAGTLANGIKGINDRFSNHYQKTVVWSDQYEINAEGFKVIQIQYKVPDGYEIVSASISHTGSHLVRSFGCEALTTTGNATIQVLVYNTLTFNITEIRTGLCIIIAKI